MRYIIYVKENGSITLTLNIKNRKDKMGNTQISLLNHALSTLSTTSDQNQAQCILDTLKAFDTKTQHSSEKFIYIGWRAEHLSEFEDCDTFWLSPREIMNLESSHAPCSSRNKDILMVWIFLYGWNKQFQVSFSKSTGWCSLIT